MFKNLFKNKTQPSQEICKICLEAELNVLSAELLREVHFLYSKEEIQRRIDEIEDTNEALKLRLGEFLTNNENT